MIEEYICVFCGKVVKADDLHFHQARIDVHHFDYAPCTPSRINVTGEFAQLERQGIDALKDDKDD